MSTINTNEGGIRNSRRLGGWIAAAAGACLLGGTAVAATGLTVQGGATPGGALTIQVANRGSGRLDDLRFHAPAGHEVQCPGITEAGRVFAAGDSLEAGDRIVCALEAPAGAAGSATIAVSARGADGRARVEYASRVLRGAAAPEQGFVALMAGAVHADDDGDGVLDAGERIDYHYNVINLGNLDVASLALTDLAGAVACPQTGLAVGADMICTSSHVVTTADAAAGEVVDQAELVGSDSLSRPVEASDLVVRLNLQARAGIRVLKAPLLAQDPDGNGIPSAGDTLGYSFVVKNGNAEDLSAVTLSEPDPALIDGPIGCAGTTLGGGAFAGNGSGALASMDAVLCAADYTVQPADDTAGQIANRVDADATAAIAGAVAGTGASLLLLPGQMALQVTKTADTATAEPGDDVTYTITVTNVGTLPIANVRITDPLPTGVATFQWACAGSSCPNAAGSGAIDETIPSFPFGGAVVYTVVAHLTASPPRTLVNVVSVSPPGLATCSPGGTAPPCEAGSSVTVASGTPAPAPAASLWSLLLLGAALALLAQRMRRARTG
jgi:uncharacterized repeat protein (TIGR01451 family)